MKIKLKCPSCQEDLMKYDPKDRYSNPAKCDRCKIVWVYDGNKKFWIKSYRFNKVKDSSGMRFV